MPASHGMLTLELQATCFNPTVSVPFPDGGFHVEAFEAHGGLIASAPALMHFLNAYWISGEPDRVTGKPTILMAACPEPTPISYSARAV